MQPTDSPIMERFYENIYLSSYENVSPEDEYAQMASLLNEMEAAKEPLEQYEDVDLEIFGDYVYKLFGIHRGSELLPRYIHILKRWDSRYEIALRNEVIKLLITNAENFDLNASELSLSYLKTLLIHCDINLNTIGMSFDDFLKIYYFDNSYDENSSDEEEHTNDSNYKANILKFLIQRGFVLPVDALDKYASRVQREATLAFQQACKIRKLWETNCRSRLLTHGFGDYNLFLVLLDNCVPCASSKSLWYATKYGESHSGIFEKALDLLLKGADPLEQFDGSNAFENLRASNEDSSFLETFVESATIIQSALRGWLARKRYAWNPHTSLGKFYALRDFAKLACK